MKTLIAEETQIEAHGIYKMFLLVIISQGCRDSIYGAAGDELEISHVTELLSANRFPLMAQKPKVVVVQCLANG